MPTDILPRILGRARSLFADEIASNADALREAIGGSRLLVIGAAGSIGTAFVGQIARYEPGSLDLVDPSENNLVEVVRDLRSSSANPRFDFRTFALAMGTLEFERFLDAQDDYDYVVNFAAIKHVRAERDPYDLMRMLRTNVIHVRDLAERLSGGATKRLFSVSSDKAVNPASIMGASKAFMERVLLANAERVAFTSARFANVAYSDGSLPHGFNNRIAKRQPISAPMDVYRYFISQEEAGQLCLIACFLGANREIFFPKLDEAKAARTFAEIAELHLEARGYAVDRCASEEEAREKAAALGAEPNAWPCYFFASDTSGEKRLEEFHAADEDVDLERYPNIGVVTRPTSPEGDGIGRALAAYEKLVEQPEWSKRDFVALVGEAVPELRHVETGTDLDQKM